MGVHRHGGTPEGATTPICDDCGVSLCWDISITEYLEAKAFWDAWKCRDCNGEPMSAYLWKLSNGAESLPEVITRVLETITSILPNYDKASEAAGQSEFASTFLLGMLKSLRIKAQMQTIATINDQPHIVVEVGEFTIDLTAAQHNEYAPYPLVFRTSLGWPLADLVDQPDQAIIDKLANLSEDEIDKLAKRLSESRKAA